MCQRIDCLRWRDPASTGNTKALKCDMSSPTQSPRETKELDPTTTPPGENDDETNDPTGEMSRNEHDPGYDFEVKEQDRWLPIANGKCTPPLCSFQ